MLLYIVFVFLDFNFNCMAHPSMGPPTPLSTYLKIAVTYFNELYAYFITEPNVSASVVVQAAVHSQRRCSTCFLCQAFGEHHSAFPRASLAAGSGTDNIPSLRSDTPLPQRISAGIPRREHSSDSRRGKTPSPTVVHNNNACR